MRLWSWVERHPIIANPLIVAVYGVVLFLLADTTDLYSPATWKQALSILILALLSGVKNAIQEYQRRA